MTNNLHFGFICPRDIFPHATSRGNFLNLSCAATYFLEPVLSTLPHPHGNNQSFSNCTVMNNINLLNQRWRCRLFCNFSDHGMARSWGEFAETSTLEIHVTVLNVFHL
ncbi:hypothetical protein ATANTOWER_028497 [Ataeniobius toweri]|uniref:Uncharacterized protein n=1 Tax=Ataeniobius toweri TaxID=208326 RepID=A0ABU7CGG8_9TELE|nr:hypothetical protein [Ataeniobius toweri]